MELKSAQEVFAVSGISGIEKSAQGKFAVSGTIAKALGLQPGVELVDSATLGNYLRDIDAKQGRAAVNRLFKNELSRQGRAFEHFTRNNPDNLFNDLKSLPHRIALTAYKSDAALNKTFTFRKYLEMAAPYVNQHAGGIIGDAIKKQYFTAGKQRWPALKMSSVKNKLRKQEKFSGKGAGRMPRPWTPLFGMTYTQTLPDGWQRYTYRWANWPWGIYTTRAGGFTGWTKGLMGAKVGEPLHKPITTFMATGKARSKSGFFKEPYTPKYEGQFKGTAYPPHMRGAALMDVVAHLAPIATVTYPYAGRGYKLALKEAASRDSPGNASMKIDGIVQPFYVAPYVFYHDTGTSRAPKRSFLSEGLADGMGMVEAVFHRYLEDGEKNFVRAYRDTETHEWKDTLEIEHAYAHGTITGDAVAKAKFKGKAGLQNEPNVTRFDMRTDNITLKHHQMKGIIRKLFGNHMIWWFVPPSKYWHYIGLMSDIRGLLFGKKNFGAATAYVKAMSIGIMGARAGSPVPFTPKARRRKFRKSLYTRAGYHRSTVGGR